MARPRALLVVFLKFPEVGRVKTRLAAGLGAGEAVAVYRGLVERTLGVVWRWVGGAGRDVWICFDPPAREAEVRLWIGGVLDPWPVSVVLRAQCEGDLGDRLSAVFTEAFSIGYQLIVSIGTDCPELTCVEIGAALKGLEEADMVVGPTPDGGYYLVGLRRPAPVVFEGIPWSTTRTLQATVAAACAAGLTVEFLAPLADVDTVEDWKSWLERSAADRPDETT